CCSAMSYCRMAVQDKPYWIGADDRRTGQWMWADNSDIRFSAFAWGQPNSSFGHCLVVAASGKWRANDCATLRRFVCEKPAEPELVVDDNLAFSTTPPPSTDDDMVYWSTTPRPSTDDDMVYWSTTPRPSTDDADDINSKTGRSRGNVKGDISSDHGTPDVLRHIMY
ncbi:hypothetical protein BaRGS_00015290, partial [Batillaria attramentaria]